MARTVGAEPCRDKIEPVFRDLSVATETVPRTYSPGSLLFIYKLLFFVANLPCWATTCCMMLDYFKTLNNYFDTIGLYQVSPARLGQAQPQKSIRIWPTASHECQRATWPGGHRKQLAVPRSLLFSFPLISPSWSFAADTSTQIKMLLISRIKSSSSYAGKNKCFVNPR